MATTVDIRDQVSAALKALRADLTPARVNPAIGRAEVILFQKHFLCLPANRFGWPSTSFWPGAARATNFSVIADGVIVSVNKQGVRQRFEGGEIKPTGGKKYLTLPARAEAYGKRAGEFELRVLYTRSGGIPRAFALAEYAYDEVKFGRARRDGSRKVTPGEAHGAVMFWLVESVSQKGNPSVIPSDNRITAVAMETIGDLVELSLRRGGKG